MAFDLAAIEAAVLAAPVSESAALPPQLAVPDYSGSETAFGVVEEPPNDLISEEVFAAQFASYHDMAGGVIAMRTGCNPPLGDVARSEGGQIAAKSLYALLSSTPALARTFLSEGSVMQGHFIALAMHGVACVNAVKTAFREHAAPPTPSPEFTSVREKQEAE